MSSETTAIFPKPSPLEGHLWARSGKNVGRRYSIGKTEQTIGRSPACDVEVEDDRVSLQHAKIVTIEGRHHIYDLGSTNGTFVNDSRVDEAELRDGDIIQVGETIYEYLCNEERALTITLRGSTDGIVPSALREGAKQMLQRERTDARPNAPAHSMPNIAVPGMAHMHAIPGQHPTPGAGVPQVPVPHMGMQVIPGVQQGPMLPIRYGQDGQLMPPGPPLYPHVTVGGDDDDDDDEVSIGEMIAKVRAIIGAFIPYWPSIAALFIIGILLGIASLKLLPPSKSAVFQMSIHTQQTENPVANFQRGNAVFFRSAEQNFVSPIVIRRTMTALGYTDLSDSAVKGFQDRLSFNKVGGGLPGHPMNVNSNTYAGSFKSPRGEEALRFLEKHLKVYLDHEVEKTLKVIRIEVDFLAKQVAEAQEELHRAEWELTEFKRKNIDALPETARSMYSRAFDLATRQRELEEEAARHSRALEHARRAVVFEAPTEESQITQVRPYAAAIVQKRQELANAESQGKGPLHPDVLRITGELKELEDLEKEAIASNAQTSVRNVNPAYRNAIASERDYEKNVEISRQHAAQLQRDLDEIHRRLADLPEREATYASLTRSFESARDSYTRLVSQEKTAKLQLELERAASGARYDIMVPPQIEVTSSLKTTGKRAAIGGFAGGMIGFARAAFVLLSAFLKSLEKKTPNREEKALVLANQSTDLAPHDPNRP